MNAHVITAALTAHHAFTNSDKVVILVFSSLLVLILAACLALLAVLNSQQ
jgi:hypothetical protein